MWRFADASHRHIPPMLGPSGNKQCKPTVQWEQQFSGRTDCLIEWCNANPTEHLKLFADSSQAAREEGRAKETIYAFDTCVGVWWWYRSCDSKCLIRTHEGW